MRVVHAVAVAVACACAARANLQVAFDDRGLSGLSLPGAELLVDGSPAVRAAVFETASRGEDGLLRVAFEHLPSSGAARAGDEPLSVTVPCAWGELRVRYAVRDAGPGQALDFFVTLVNRSDRVLADFDLALARLRFPAGPAVLGGQGKVLSTLDDLPVLDIPFGIDAEAGAPGPSFGVTDISERLAVCCLTGEPPVRFGLADGSDWGREYTLVVRGNVPSSEPGGVTIPPHGGPRIAPGGRLDVVLSLRFGPAAAPADALTADLPARFREFHPPRPAWPDRRGIGMVMLSSSWEGHQSATNPRGWFNEKTIDVITPAGREDFRRRALEYAARSVKVLTGMNAQGMVVWDPEGQENRHPVSYIGDPRMVGTFAPEFDAVADEFFRVFRDAGLRTGVCIRPTQVYVNEEKGEWDHGTGSHGPGRNPLGDDYEALRPPGLPWWRFYPVAERLSRKIARAKERWGCSLFYIDTNGTYRPRGEEDRFEWCLLEAAILKQVAADHPDVLLIPELAAEKDTFHLAYWSCSSPYFELDLGGVSTPERVRRYLPGAFSVLNMSDGPFAERRAELCDAVRRGDILMFHGWWSPERNAEVRSVYEEVYLPGAVAPPGATPAKP